MDKLGPTLLILAILALIFLGMWLGWRGRRRRDAELAPRHDVPADPGETLVDAEAFYVATTQHERPLERLALPGLGFRARARLRLHPAGAVLSIPGEEDVFIATADLVSVAPATVAIDRVVEPDGLVALTWRLRGTVVDSYLRVVDPQTAVTVFRSLRGLIPTESEV